MIFLSIGNQPTLMNVQHKDIPEGAKVKVLKSIVPDVLAPGNVYTASASRPDLDWLFLKTERGEEPIMKEWVELVEDSTSTKKCECGADKTYGSNTMYHSPWCPKYEQASN